MAVTETQRVFRVVRRFAGLTQLALAKVTGVASYKIARWEKGKAELTPGEIKRLQDAVTDAGLARSKNEQPEEPSPENHAKIHAKNVATTRRGYGISQKELAKRAGMTQGDISKYENGYLALDLDHEIRLMDALEKLIAERRPIPEQQEVVIYAQPDESLVEDISDAPIVTPKLEPLHATAEPSADDNKFLMDLIESYKNTISAQSKFISVCNEQLTELRRQIASLEEENRRLKGS
jgi:transcriptional regulator with XRE-family HTH domain